MSEDFNVIGRQLSHYRIVEQLGRGGMGTVYRAEDTLLGRSVAVKFPHRELARDPKWRARFLREARAASALDHPNIVVLYDICEVEGELFLAMQFVPGRTLREQLRSRPLPPLAEALGIGRALAEALAHAHDHGIVHRDVKPENVLLGPRGVVKLADFGTALLLPDRERVTLPGGIAGTAGYIAPELLSGGEPGPQSDLFSLGEVLYELASGRRAFEGDTAAAILYRAAHESPPPLPAALPAELRRLIERLLEKAPDRRPAAVEVANLLARLSAAALAATSAPLDAAPAPPAHSTPAMAPSSTPFPERSLAVLPFENLTGNAEDDYFCAGVTEDILTEVLKVHGLRVASRSLVTAVGCRSLDPRETGRVLGVAAVLEGGVRRAGARVRVTARLARTDTGYQLWAERYDRSLEDIFEVQEDIARRIAEALRVAFEPKDEEARLGRRARSPRAYDLRLQALAHYRRLEEEDTRRAIAVLEEAVREDAEYALARADLAECCVQMFCKGWDTDPAWLDQAEAQAHRALEIAPSLPEGYRARGHLWNHRRQIERALRDFHHAVDLDPRYAEALNSLCVNYVMLGDPGRAEIYARRAIGLDPCDPRSQHNLVAVLLRQRRFAECRAEAPRAFELASGPRLRLVTRELVMLSHLWEDDLAGVQQVAQEIEREAPERPLGRCLRALAAAAGGDPEAARRLLTGIEGPPEPPSTVLVSVARVRLMLEDREAALALLERASALDVLDLHELRHDPHLSRLTGEPRFERLFAAQS